MKEKNRESAIIRLLFRLLDLDSIVPVNEADAPYYSKVESYQNAIQAVLPEAHKNLAKELENAAVELGSNNYDYYFEHGFSLGLLIGIEAAGEFDRLITPGD